ncbi:MAG: hypothetical protein U1F43_02535 [Myxococcota bacterium]
MNELPQNPGFDRDGHLTELGLSRLLYGEGSGAALQASERHIASCATCAAVLAAMRVEDAALAIPEPPLAAHRAARRLSPRTAIVRRVAVAAVGVLAIAAAVVLTVRVSPSGLDGADRLRPRGSKLELSVHVHDGTASHLVESGGVVHVGNRAGFEVLLADDGFLIVAGMDDAGDVYPCYPQEVDPMAVFTPKTTGRVLLPTAIEFDETPGEEHIFGILCDRPYRLDEVRPAMIASLLVPSVATPPPGCTMKRVDLRKPATP